MKALVVPNFQKQQTAALLEQLTALAQQVGLTLCTATGEADSLSADQLFARQLDCLAGCDVLISIGGDGTIMHCARLSALSGKPIMGINAGHLGFLAQVEQATLERALVRLVSADYTIEYRGALSATFGTVELPPIDFALNDIVLTKTGADNMAWFEMFCDSRRIDGYRADGLILSTATGSTAYNLSAGGPVIDPQLDSVCLVPICPHALTGRPLVFSSARTLRVETGEATVSVLADGSQRRLLPADSWVEISASAHRAAFVTFHELEFFEIVTKKIKQRG